jgi:hypothetical protein
MIYFEAIVLKLEISYRVIYNILMDFGGFFLIEDFMKFIFLHGEINI